MKNLLLIVGVVISAISTANAQTPATPLSTGSVKVKVNVELTAFQTIEIGTAGQDGQVSSGYADEVTLRYEDTDDYKNGVQKTIANQLKVSSVGTGYKIITTFGNNGIMSKDYGTSTTPIDASRLLDIEIDGIVGQGTFPAKTYTFGTLGDATTSVLDKSLSVKYIGKPLINAYLLKDLLNDFNSAKYNIDVVYTIAAN